MLYKLKPEVIKSSWFPFSLVTEEGWVQIYHYLLCVHQAQRFCGPGSMFAVESLGIVVGDVPSAPFGRDWATVEPLRSLLQESPLPGEKTDTRIMAGIL